MLPYLVLYRVSVEGRIPATGNPSQPPDGQEERVVVDVVVGHNVDLAPLLEPLGLQGNREPGIILGICSYLAMPFNLSLTISTTSKMY